MSEVLGALYHWAPADRREDIFHHGLHPFSPPALTSSTIGYVCLGTTPSAAWGLSGDMEWVQEIEDWDLWQVRLADGDHVTIRSEWGPVLKEIRVFNVLAADRVWWVGQRAPWLIADENGKPT